MIKCREWQGWEEFLKKQLTKRKWEEGKCGKAGDGRDGSAVPNGLTGSVVGGGASVHRAQCSPLIHLDRQTIPDKSSNKTVPTFLLSNTNVTYIRKGWFFLREIWRILLQTSDPCHLWNGRHKPADLLAFVRYSIWESTRWFWSLSRQFYVDYFHKFEIAFPVWSPIENHNSTLALSPLSLTWYVKLRQPRN